MARKKQEPEKKKKVNTDGIMGLHGSTTEQAISETLELNYMPYAMSVIVSRAIPEIDGFKPSPVDGRNPPILSARPCA